VPVQSALLPQTLVLPDTKVSATLVAVTFGSVSLPSTVVSAALLLYVQVTGRPRKLQVNDPCTLEVVMIPFVVSLRPSVATLDGHGLVLEAVVVALTELQRVELRPAKLMILILPAPLAELTMVP